LVVVVVDEFDSLVNLRKWQSFPRITHCPLLVNLLLD
jgi:hypothetical protein